MSHGRRLILVTTDSPLLYTWYLVSVVIYFEVSIALRTAAAEKSREQLEIDGWIDLEFFFV